MSSLPARVTGFKFRAAVAIFVVALALRLLGLSWGLPTEMRWYSYHPDEAQMLSAILSLDFFGGDFNPDFFNYPSLYIYLAAFAHLFASGFGLTHAASNDPAQAALFARDVLLCARVVTALLGALTAPIVFLTARKIGGAKIGVLAGLLMAFSPGHLQHSHFATVDVPATFFIALCLWLCTRALGGADRKWKAKQLFFAAFVAGLAAATKYNAALVLIAPLGAWLLLWRRERLSAAAALPLVPLAIIAFLLACPFSLLDFGTFWGDGQNAGVAYELLVHPKQGHGDVFVQTGNGWLYHLTLNAPFLLTLPVLLAAVVGLVAAPRVQEPAARNAALLLLLWCALYFFALGFSQVRFMRYLLPLAPALCVFAACGVVALRPLRATLAKAAGVLLLAVSSWGARDVLYPLMVPDARDQAAQWMSQNTTPPATVGMIDMPWFYSPPLSPLDSPPGRRLSPDEMFRLTNGRYRIIVTGLDAAHLKAASPEFFVLSEMEWREKERLNDAGLAELLSVLKAQYFQVARFETEPPLALPGREFVPHDFLYPTPEVRIYRRIDLR